MNIVWVNNKDINKAKTYKHVTEVTNNSTLPRWPNLPLLFVLYKFIETIQQY